MIRYRDLRILQHERETLARIRRLERYIRATSLQDAEKADDHLERTFDAYPDQYARPDAKLSQVMRQSIGALIQLAICQPLLAKCDRQSLWRRRGSRLEQVNDGCLARIVRPGMIPFHQDLAPLLSVSSSI